MNRSAVNALIGTVGVLIVATCVFLFVQCKQIGDGNVSIDTQFAQTVLDDVIRNVASRSTDGVKPSDAARALYSRVSLYTLVGFVLIGVAWYRQYGGWAPNIGVPIRDRTSSES